MPISSDAYVDGVGWIGECQCGQRWLFSDLNDVYAVAHLHLDSFPDHQISVWSVMTVKGSAQ